MRSSRFRRCIVLTVLPSASIEAQEVRHPLDALNWQEYWTVLEMLQAADHLDGDTRFQIVTLQEPDKDIVLAWSSGEAIPRAAFAVVRQQDKAYCGIQSECTTWCEQKTGRSCPPCGAVSSYARSTFSATTRQ